MIMKKSLIMSKINFFKKIFREASLVSSEYSWKLAAYNLLWWFAFCFRTPLSYRISSFALRKKKLWLDHFIEKNYSGIIDESRNILDASQDAERRIWVFWYQGEESMPVLVKSCYRQLTAYNDNVTLITQDNVSSYLSVPETIMERVGKGTFSPTHLSDLIRTLLLAKYGGLWVDATVWTAGNVFCEKLEALDFFSPNGKVRCTARGICFWTSGMYNWSTWCMYAAKKNMQLFAFVSRMLCAVATDKKVFPDYVFMDYLIDYACRNFKESQRVISSCQGLMGEKRNALAEIMNEPYDEQKLKTLTERDMFFKLSYRTPWSIFTPSGKETFYGKIISFEKNA